MGWAEVRGPDSPFRAPDERDAALMTRRAWWLAVAHVLVPGSAQSLAGHRRLARLALRVWIAGAALVVLGAVCFLLLPQLLFTVFTNAVGLSVVQAALVAWMLLWVALSVDTARALRLVRVRPAARAGLAILLTAALVTGVGAASWGVWAAGVARGTIGKVFGATGYALPADGRYNVLLLGGDAGKGRSGLRPDSISVVSVNAITGRTVMYGLPRNLTDIPFAAGSPMRAEYPHGYGWHDTCDVDVCQLNSIYTEAELKHPGRYPEAVAQHSSPGIEATREAVEGALGIRIQYYLLVDMGAFATLVDALGGVTVTVTQRLPIGGGVDADGNPTGVKVWIEPGVRHLNGNRAEWFARSRHGIGNDDYHRMARQRELEQAMLRQLNPVVLLTRFDRIAAASGDAVQTDIPQGLLGVFTGLAVKARGQRMTTVEFVPPTYDPSAPDWSRIRSKVRATLP